MLFSRRFVWMGLVIASLLNGLTIWFLYYIGKHPALKPQPALSVFLVFLCLPCGLTSWSAMHDVPSERAVGPLPKFAYRHAETVMTQPITDDAFRRASNLAVAGICIEWLLLMPVPWVVTSTGSLLLYVVLFASWHVFWTIPTRRRALGL